MALGTNNIKGSQSTVNNLSSVGFLNVKIEFEQGIAALHTKRTFKMGPLTVVMTILGSIAGLTGAFAAAMMFVERCWLQYEHTKMKERRDQELKPKRYLIEYEDERKEQHIVWVEAHREQGRVPTDVNILASRFNGKNLDDTEIDDIKTDLRFPALSDRTDYDELKSDVRMWPAISDRTEYDESEHKYDLKHTKAISGVTDYDDEMEDKYAIGKANAVSERFDHGEINTNNRMFPADRTDYYDEDSMEHKNDLRLFPAATPRTDDDLTNRTDQIISPSLSRRGSIDYMIDDLPLPAMN